MALCKLYISQYFVCYFKITFGKSGGHLGSYRFRVNFQRSYLYTFCSYMYKYYFCQQIRLVFPNKSLLRVVRSRGADHRLCRFSAIKLIVPRIEHIKVHTKEEWSIKIKEKMMYRRRVCICPWNHDGMGTPLTVTTLSCPVEFTRSIKILKNQDQYDIVATFVTRRCWQITHLLI